MRYHIRAMPSAPLISANEYLTATYRPDREWIDGGLLERNVGEYEHSRLQLAL